MDVLSDVLDTLRLRGTLYFSTEFHQPWGLRVPALRRVARFHLVVRGTLWVRVTGQTEPVQISSGDLILIPHGAEHVLYCSDMSAVRTMDDVVAAAGFTGRGVLVYGGEDRGAPTRLVCGHFEYDESLDHSLLEQLPASIVVRWEHEVQNSPLADAFSFITREVQAARPGHDAVVRRLSEVLFFLAVRTWAEREESQRGLLAALADPALAAALTAMHERPAERWSLDSLSRRAAMGRSAFAERFHRVVGATPMRYLTDWRVQRAKRLLAESKLGLDGIAAQVGYDSAASLSRVFQKHTGVSPGVYRRQHPVPRSGADVVATLPSHSAS
jgi:AraC family transcriptional regulator, activator of mtrCDE